MIGHESWIMMDVGHDRAWVMDYHGSCWMMGHERAWDKEYHGS